jgi:hypothetical protein
MFCLKNKYSKTSILQKFIVLYVWNINSEGVELLQMCKTKLALCMASKSVWRHRGKTPYILILALDWDKRSASFCDFISTKEAQHPPDRRARIMLNVFRNWTLSIHSEALHFNGWAITLCVKIFTAQDEPNCPMSQQSSVFL